MQPGPPYNQGINCARCGAMLELPADLTALHADCPYCGLDNVLPEHVVHVRRQQLYAIQQQQAAEQARAERARARAASAHSTNQLIIGLGIILFLGVGTCAALYISAGRRLEDPAQNGEKALKGELAKLQEQGCERIVVAPRKHSPGDKAEVSLADVNGERPCVHVLGATSKSDKLKLRDRYSMMSSMPAPASNINYRFCGGRTSDQTFVFETEKFDVYWVAAIECPRLPSEGGSRTKADDLVGTGKAAVRKRVAELEAKGCNDVVQDTTVARGDKDLKLTFAASASCYNFFVGSSFTDMKFTLSLTDPNGNPMPVPDPAREMRLVHCPTRAGDYKLAVKPSTPDHYAFAGLDCPRDGPEGVRRERELRALRDTGAKPK